MIAQLREFVELIERLNVAFGGPIGERSVLFQGEHFTLSESTDTVRELPTSKKKGKKKPKGQLKTGWKRGSGQPVMNMAKDPSIWPFESGRKAGARHERSRRVQSVFKKVLTGSSPISRAQAFRLVSKRLSAELREQKDDKGRFSWEMTLGALIRNYSKAGYLVRVANFNPNKEMISLPGKAV